MIKVRDRDRHGRPITREVYGVARIKGWDTQGWVYHILMPYDKDYLTGGVPVVKSLGFELIYLDDSISRTSKELEGLIWNHYGSDNPIDKQIIITNKSSLMKFKSEDNLE
ncbi:hypothetical protein_gp262 [Bacillus phage vB_BceM_WH1]|nr:hypothetical protein_gp262 [Bacillus phage vB_BceM_WH1]